MSADSPADPPLVDLSKVNHPLARLLMPVAGPLIRRLLKIDDLNAYYAGVAARATPETIFDVSLEDLGCRYEVSESDLGRIPLTGPVVVVANHPLGGLDGIVLGQLLLRRRPDAKLMANYLLKRVRHLDRHMIFVDPFAHDKPTAQNIAPLRESLKHLKGGGLLGVFPGNRVSHFQKERGEICDTDWVPHVAALIRKSGATVVPIFINDQNSDFFCAVGAWHSALRTALLPREYLNRGRSGVPIEVRVGTPIPAARLARFASDEARIGYLRTATYILRHRPKMTGDSSKRGLPAHFKPLAEKLPPEQLEADLAALPAEAKLYSQGDCDVYVASQSQIPHLIHEIGRGREESFRFAGGGTGEPEDLAAADAYYDHLFVWNRKDRAVVGAYRLGRADEILAEHGPEGLVCNGLFDFDEPLLERFRKMGLELGRSYIIPAYMRSYSSLILLWSGILAFIGKNPRYRQLFGSVGISQGDEYCAASRALIVNYLRTHHSEAETAAWVHSKSPLPGSQFGAAETADLLRDVHDIDDVNQLVSSLEPSGKGVPVLIRHYLRMNARLVSFGVWTAHSRAVVAFMVHALETADARLLRRYMDPAAYQRFLEFHGLAGASDAEGKKASAPSDAAVVA
ncbi:MAG: lysophospholipid acyltransferase family protein [Verrucomicrobiales bacterium]|nr:lysophospholipid acyltransferase family protein [Verrucomicrobiales bacterium]